jgi:hypothetical protein
MKGKGISLIVGRAELADGSIVSLYRALRPLMCATCVHTIAEDELFTRRKLGELRISPRCRKCVPFKLKAGGAQSQLIRNLLTPSSEEIPGPTPADKLADRQKIVEAVQRRLGPALERARRSRREG